MSDFARWLAEAADRREACGLTRQLVTATPGALLDLAGNDYLGLRTDSRVIEAAVAAARTHGAGAGASRLVTGTHPVHDHLEAALAELTQTPAALVFSSGYAANLAALTTLTDHDTLIVSDAHAHASLIDGARLSRAARRVVAAHNDVEDVARHLRERTEPRAVVVVESVFSVLGDAADLPALVELTARHNALLVVDEAHSIGLLGPAGGGLLTEHGLAGVAHVIVTGTLSKSLASQGGFVAASAAVREHLINTARSFIYDTGLNPAAAGAALGAIEVLAIEPHRRTDVRQTSARLARALGIEPPAAAVMSMPMPGPDDALQAVAEAGAHGIRIGCFRPPSTPDGRSRLRLTAHAGIAEADLAHAAEVLARFAPAETAEVGRHG